MGNSPRVGVRLIDKQHAELLQIAKELNVSVSELVRHGVLLILYGLERQPQLGFYSDRLGLPNGEIHRKIPVVKGWVKFIPEKEAAKTETRGW